MKISYTDPAEFSFQGRTLPRHMHDGIRLYMERGVDPGSFLCLIFSNDFVHAAAIADTHNLEALQVYAAYLYSGVPQLCWGSLKKVSDWVSLQSEDKDN